MKLNNKTSQVFDTCEIWRLEEVKIKWILDLYSLNLNQMKSFFRISLCLFLAFNLTGCADQNLFKETRETGKTALAEEAMVVTAHPEATKVGYEILKDGGNAIDATVGVHFALAVVYPAAGNLGGGGFMVYRENNGEAHTLDFREMAPSAAHEDMYLDEEGMVIRM